MQDHKVFARHNTFGTFQVPKEFLNANKKAPAAVAPKKAVRQARRACMFSMLRYRTDFAMRFYLISNTHASTA